jgi:homoserine acetyltransferase
MTIPDDVRIHKLVPDQVTSVALAIAGSMGGIAVLKWF